jgi:endoglucanase
MPGLSAYEEPVRSVIAEAWRPLVDELSVSKLGSLHGLRRSRSSGALAGKDGITPPRILLSAHMDAIGMMVTAIEKGLLRVTSIGGLDPRVLAFQPVVVHGRRDLPGLLAMPPDRLLPEEQAGKPVKKRHWLIDVGLLPSEVAELVRTGDLVSMATQPSDLTGDALSGHSLDNRASVAAITLALQELQRVSHAWDVWAVASTQEETSFGGAYTSPFDIRPDIAIAIDVTFAKGPGVNDYRGYGLGKGSVIGWGPNVHPAVFKALKELAVELDRPYQVEAMPRHSGTDAYAMQVVAEGIPTGVVSIPLRYMHTPVEVVSMKDVSRTGRLLAQFIARLEPDFMAKINWEEEG